MGTLSIDAFEGWPSRSPNARSTAALLDNPACDRRVVLQAARVDMTKIAAALGAPGQFGQSPFAIGQGNRFEERVKADGHAELVRVLNETLGLFEGVSELRSVNMERPEKGIPWSKLLEVRARHTADHLESIAKGDEGAPNVIDHGVTTLEVGGSTVYLEQDALAFRDGDQLRVCEVKGFPIIDGTASPEKVGAAVRQTAVYVASLQDTMAARGHNPSVVSTSVVLICPHGFGIRPTGVVLDVRRELRALRRQLSRQSRVTDLLTDLELAAASEGLDPLKVVAEAIDGDGKPIAETTRRLIDLLPNRYAPSCLTSCDLGRLCRQEATEADDPARLGGETASLTAGLGTATDLLVASEDPESAGEAREVAIVIDSARRALDQARRLVP